MNKLITLKECSPKIGLSLSALRKNITRKQLNLPPYYKVGNQYLFWEKELDDWLNQLPSIYVNQYTSHPVYKLFNSSNEFLGVCYRRGRPKNT